MKELIENIKGNLHNRMTSGKTTAIKKEDYEFMCDMLKKVNEYHDAFIDGLKSK